MIYILFQNLLPLSYTIEFFAFRAISPVSLERERSSSHLLTQKLYDFIGLSRGKLLPHICDAPKNSSIVWNSKEMIRRTSHCHTFRSRKFYWILAALPMPRGPHATTKGRIIWVYRTSAGRSQWDFWKTTKNSAASFICSG
ncbi:MAG: hypothetical protein Ct9H300mP28_32150 [Pseudomonadota bacterium]|nr:MAG: hypothetical protein Ct9H300mP28_32150 [Pseudomonadota bacterium]